MGSLKIIKPGMLTSFQDKGRKGMAFYAFPQSGCLDVNAAALANAVLNKKENASLLECNIIGPLLEFLTPTQIALSGADFDWSLNGDPIKLYSVIDIKSGDILKAKSAKDGARGYIAINGKVQLQEIYGSVSTYTSAAIGGFSGRALRKDDLVEWTDYPRITEHVQMDVTRKQTNKIGIHKGPEFNWLNECSKKNFLTTFFTLSSDSNRMGARLTGEQLKLYDNKTLDYSVPVLPGFIQLPPGGNPIVLLNDGQTTGGYPRIGYIPDEGLSRFSNLKIGKEFKFELIEK